MNPIRLLFVTTIGIWGLAAVRADDKLAAVGSADLSALPANTWVKLAEEKTGGRSSPMFFYEPRQKVFCLLGGVPGGAWNEAKKHYIVETFDPRTCKWSNAYPLGASWKVESGPTDAPTPERDGRSLPLKEIGGILSLYFVTDPYGTDSSAHFQWAYDTDTRRLFAYLHNRTVTYDPASRAWNDTGAARFSKGPWGMSWGNMCYDPVNREVLSIGGSSDERGGTPGTHVFVIAENAWKKVESGSKELRSLHSRCQTVRRQAHALLSACRSRYFLTESGAEAKAKFSEKAVAVEAAVRQLLTGVTAAKLPEKEAESAGHAAARLAEAADKARSISSKLDGTMSAELIAQVKPVLDSLDMAELALAAEPPGRAHSQPAFDPKSGKIVLVGGSGLDRCYSDTWLYDPKTRTWQQRWPKLSPSPRAGHVLVSLPKSGKLALAGGYTIDGWFDDVPHQVWTYDVAANEWKLHMALPVGKKRDDGLSEPSAGAPRAQIWETTGGGNPWVGAAMPDDVLVMVDAGGLGRATRACRLEPSKADAGEAQKVGVPPGTMSFSMQPAEAGGRFFWTAFGGLNSRKWVAGKPDAALMAEFFAKLPANRWTSISHQPLGHAGQATLAYDPDRQQFLAWGGGHCGWMADQVDHYSVRANRWTLGFAPDLPTSASYFMARATLSFRDRPQMPVHPYKAIAYDRPSGKMFCLDRAYDVAERDWDPEPYPGLQHKGVMHSMLESTPSGVVCISEAGLFRFEWPEKRWKRLPWNGPVKPSIWCDGGSLCYDSKRDCLWWGTHDLNRYDLKTGTVEKVEVRKPKWMEFSLCRDPVYVPEADLLLVAQMFKKPYGTRVHVAFDPAQIKYYAVDLPYEEGKTPNFDWRWNVAQHYDARLGAVIKYVFYSQDLFHALRFDRKTAKMTEISE